MEDKRPVLLLLVAPALAMVLVLFVYPLGYSLVSAFTDRGGQPSLANFAKTFDLYGTDILFTPSPNCRAESKSPPPARNTRRHETDSLS
jgi:ABC-type sugar transport system permease subunit